MTMGCVKCNGIAVDTHVVLDFGIQAKAWKCRKCGEIYLDSADAQKALLLNKLKNGVDIKIGSLGGSMIMRFPAQIAALLQLKKGATVKATPKSEEGKGTYVELRVA